MKQKSISTNTSSMAAVNPTSPVPRSQERLVIDLLEDSPTESQDGNNESNNTEQGVTLNNTNLSKTRIPTVRATRTFKPNKKAAKTAQSPSVSAIEPGKCNDSSNSKSSSTNPTDRANSLKLPPKKRKFSGTIQEDCVRVSNDSETKNMNHNHGPQTTDQRRYGSISGESPKKHKAHQQNNIDLSPHGPPRLLTQRWDTSSPKESRKAKFARYLASKRPGLFARNLPFSDSNRLPPGRDFNARNSHVTNSHSDFGIDAREEQHFHDRRITPRNYPDRPAPAGDNHRRSPAEHPRGLYINTNPNHNSGSSFHPDFRVRNHSLPPSRYDRRPYNTWNQDPPRNKNFPVSMHRNGSDDYRMGAIRFVPPPAHRPPLSRPPSKSSQLSSSKNNLFDVTDTNISINDSQGSIQSNEQPARGIAGTTENAGHILDLGRSSEQMTTSDDFLITNRERDNVGRRCSTKENSTIAKESSYQDFVNKDFPSNFWSKEKGMPVVKNMLDEENTAEAEKSVEKLSSITASNEKRAQGNATESKSTTAAKTEQGKTIENKTEKVCYTIVIATFLSN
jgi:hypothetical protein